MILRSLGEVLSTFSQYQLDPGNMVNSAGTLKRWLAGLLALQTVVAEYGAPPALHDGQLGAVASESDICSHIGIDLLKLGGNAADAMVGTVFCVGVVGMYHSGKSDVNSHQSLLTWALDWN
jgi:gamma-glutamyltranspeptidase/glutathione hydrolase